MVKKISRRDFSVVEFDSSRVNLHLHEDDRRKSLSVFVHGLGGRGYKTWGRLPGMIFNGGEGMPPADVAVYDYESGLRALFRRGADPAFHAAQLREALDRLSDDYGEIYIAAHSLGGLIAHSAVHSYLADVAFDGGPEVTPIAALALFASPSVGSRWGDLMPSLLFREKRWLQRLPPQPSEAIQFFATRVEGHAVGTTGGRRFLLPRYAAVGDKVRFVNRISATFAIDKDQITYLAGTHSSIVKPAFDDLAQLRWLHEIMTKVDLARTQLRREAADAARHRAGAATPPPSPVTRLLVGSQGARWAEIYDEVRLGFSESAAAVEDHRRRPDLPITLIFAVVGAKAVLERRHTITTIVSTACGAYTSDQVPVGIFVVGTNASAAEAVIHDSLPTDMAPGPFFVQGTASEEGLRNLMWRRLVAEFGTAPPRTSQEFGGLTHPHLGRHDGLGRYDYR
ncbi:hypothetical protein [Embleya scabrispora]|uniref:hypothetical protein n=1 Tax=Embleya scabrispora TaxID=159449 RepID=UPI00131A2D11|nr:hypothetical protein [Embleya scabrispora]MYS87773.1 hypothetical protein [Streptomyces sp. SID5474]